ncbi:MAG: tetratricopeptide repeat protein [Rikenellaceae bacterium]|nr:tetratricopeptide repeat protein [Rikenellaceae bacterium]MBP3682226.1 tetratricopeptide repeat protein [Rikenellaceae bacterium]MBQ6691625.1 tetratricopeptide repeat protein [Rikenellaceae bacterium]MBQ8745303.1 tetratricopeptide repeat protein [Rikenellaceae bacterium]MBR2501660.1 tetratricopeptide repeat protein [Rikenellaceae bacterium]
MRKYIIGLLTMLSLLVAHSASAQYNKEYFFWVGRHFLIENNYSEAIKTLNILLRVDEEAYEAYFLRGIAKYNLDDLLGAEVDFTSAIEKNPVFTNAYTYRAITRSRLGNYDDALKDFQEAIDLRPDLPNPYYSRGVTRLLNQQFKEAIEDFDMFIRHDAKVIDAYINRGTSYLYLKDTVAAYDNYNLAIRTNRENPDGYNRRGSLLMAQERYEEALADFNKAVECDSSYLVSFFNRAIVHSHLNRPVESLADFDRTIELDSTNSLAYFNRAIVRSHIGDYNRALEDYNQVAYYTPENVLVYYNRALLHTQLGNLNAALNDYNRAIELYPDFANAYINRGNIRYMLRDTKGARQDRQTADRKIAEYRSKLKDSVSYSIYSDTTHRFDQLLSFDTKMAGSNFERITTHTSGENLALIPLFRFTITRADSITTIDPKRYHLQRVEDFVAGLSQPDLVLSRRESDIPTDSLVELDSRLAERIADNLDDWQPLFLRGITQSLIKQYTNAVATYTSAIEQAPSNPFLYLNRSTTQAEMIDFISSIDNSYQRITIDADPVNRLQNASARSYNYDEAIADLNKAIKLYPSFAYAYYNRANLQALSGKLPEAFEDYTKAIELWPNFAEAYYNRGLVQIYMKDTRKGCLDLSKAGELGIANAYQLLQRYASAKHN